MSTLRSARDRARSEVTAEILSTAREHLALYGAAGLSLRAVARDLGMVSSAVYRYFENRDVLLTALIVEAYNSLGEAVEGSVARSERKPPSERWVKAAETIRTWALSHPQEYALLYGSPVPGYSAPQDTIVPGTRVSLALVGIVTDAHRAGVLNASKSASDPDLSKPVRADMGQLSRTIGIEILASELFRALLAWTQLFGLLSFELFGQTKGLVVDHAAFFHDAATAMAARIGL